MKRWLSVIGILAGLAVWTSPGTAQINLSWDNCGAAGTADKVFACNTNSANHVMIASFIAPVGVNLFTSNEVVLDFKSSTDPLPDWWRLRNQTGQLGQCRNGSLSATADFSAATGCVDQWAPAGGGSGGIGTYRVGGPAPGTDLSRVRLTLVFSVTAGSEQVLVPGTEYYAARIAVNSLKTVGTGLCAGCDVPMSVTLNGIRVVQPAGAPGGNIMLTDPAANRTITWQGGAGAPPVSTQASTWGQVKSLYR